MAEHVLSLKAVDDFVEKLVRPIFFSFNAFQIALREYMTNNFLVFVRINSQKSGNLKLMYEKNALPLWQTSLQAKSRPRYSSQPLRECGRVLLVESEGGSLRHLRFSRTQQIALFRRLPDMERMGGQYPVKTFVLDKMTSQMRAAKAVCGCDIMLCYFHARQAIRKHKISNRSRHIFHRMAHFDNAAEMTTYAANQVLRHIGTCTPNLTYHRTDRFKVRNPLLVTVSLWYKPLNVLRRLPPRMEPSSAPLANHYGYPAYTYCRYSEATRSPAAIAITSRRFAQAAGMVGWQTEAAGATRLTMSLVVLVANQLTLLTAGVREIDYHTTVIAAVTSLAHYVEIFRCVHQFFTLSVIESEGLLSSTENFRSLVVPFFCLSLSGEQILQPRTTSMVKIDDVKLEAVIASLECRELVTIMSFEAGYILCGNGIRTPGRRLITEVLSKGKVMKILELFIHRIWLTTAGNASNDKRFTSEWLAYTSHYRTKTPFLVHQGSLAVPSHASANTIFQMQHCWELFGSPRLRRVRTVSESLSVLFSTCRRDFGKRMAYRRNNLEPHKTPSLGQYFTCRSTGVKLGAGCWKKAVYSDRNSGYSLGLASRCTDKASYPHKAAHGDLIREYSFQQCSVLRCTDDYLNGNRSVRQLRKYERLPYKSRSPSFLQRISSDIIISGRFLVSRKFTSSSRTKHLRYEPNQTHDKRKYSNRNIQRHGSGWYNYILTLTHNTIGRFAVTRGLKVDHPDLGTETRTPFGKRYFDKRSTVASCAGHVVPYRILFSMLLRIFRSDLP
ncbi:hypothetical protein CLF_111097 [Clonorchis sinensis]|uniref:Uncharacterized protein n=1 Tax=Clonorchis sinensis TaxID=79923 RepID=G7YUC7_CLOSI|nr:hypothetical protein CLF_111097 [Clonorchis sinensis]